MSRAANKLIKAAAGADVEDTGDDDFANVVLLLDGDGTSDDNNNTFTNSGSTVTTIDTTGDVVQGSFSPYGDNWSVYFDSSAANQYLQVADSSTFDATTSLCIEAWFYMTTAPGSGPNAHAIVSKWVSTTPGQRTVFIDIEDTGLRVGLDIQGASNPVMVATDGGAISQGEWHHVAVTWDGSTYRAFLDGVLEGSTSNSSAPIASSQVVRVGYNTNAHYFGGYISNVRWVTNGGAIYTSNFTPPTSPLTAISGTVLLLNSANRFVDESTNNHTVTINGNPKVTPFSPFKNDDARDITTDGGSFYIAGSGDHVDISDHNDLDFGTGDFTVEFWAYFDEGTNNQDGIISKGNTGTGWQIIFADTDRLKFIRTSGNASSPQITSSTSSVVEYQWHHIALTRSGTTVTLFINGVSEGSYTDSTSWDTSEPLRLGTNRGENNDYVGYISDLRVFKGFAKYTAGFDLPTAPLGGIDGSAYTLNNVEYENKSFDAGSQDGSPFGVEFNSDGTKMYIAGAVNDTIYQYVLTTAFDVSTASYDNKSFSVASEDVNPHSVRFKTDGSKMYIVGSANDAVYQYSLSTSYDVSTASYDSVSFSVTSQATGPQGLTFSSDGTKMYIVGSSSDTIYQYTLSTAWDISTASYDNKSLSVSGQEAAPSEVLLNNDGTKIFIVGYSSDRIRQYSMTTAYDLSTASFDDLSYFTRSEESNPRGMTFNSDGSKIYIVGTTNDTVYQYSLTNSKNPELLLNFQDAGIYDRAGINNIDTVGDARLGHAPIYGTGSLAFDGTGDYLQTVNNPDVNFGSGAFTIEAWVHRFTTPSGGIEPIIGGNTTTDSGSDTFSFHISTSRYFEFGSGTTYTTSDTIFPLNQWVHLAVSYDGTTLKMFQDGVEVASAAKSFSFDFERFKIGRTRSNSREADQYLDDLRVTKGVARYTSAFTPPDEIDLSTDTHREYVTLFLDGDGTVNGQNNTFTDSSTNGYTITEAGSVAQGVFSPYGDNWSNSFDGSGDGLSIATDSALDWGTSTDFTMECWFYSDVALTSNTILFDTRNTSSAGTGVLFGINSSSKLVLVVLNNFDITGTTSIEAGQWYHLAVVRNSGTFEVFIDGVSEGTSSTSRNIQNANGITVGGKQLSSTSYDSPTGYISNARVVSGTAVYTSAYSPPTSPLSAVTNTTLLTCQSNRFVDNSSSSRTVTVTGTPKVSRFSPFESNKPYDITTDGGSAYFDGVKTTQLYAGTSNVIPATGDFTIEGWVYFTGLNTSNNRSVFFVKDSGTTASGNRSFQAIFNNNGTKYDDLSIALFQTNTNYDVSTFTHTFEFNEWYHVAVTRTGQTIECFINGTSIGTDTNAKTSINQTTEENYIASWNSSNKDDTHVGYFGDFRIVHSRVYTSDFTPPTSPLTAIANTELLLNFQDSAIPDLSGINNIDTVGNAKVAGTDPTKYGSNAIQFDGTGDGLSLPETTSFDFGSNDFTIEAWAYLTTNGVFNNIVSAGVDTANGYRLDISTSNNLRFLADIGGSWTTVITGSTSLATGQWYHLAVTRNGNNFDLWVDGSSDATTVSNSGTITEPTTKIEVGAVTTNSLNRSFNGYLDDVRVTKGVARYTSNFTAPTEALPKF